MPDPLLSNESRTSLVRRARKIDRVLGQTYPDATIELDFDDPFQLLVVTVLSAQTTDANVQGIRRFNEALAKERRVAATEIQTVGVKGYDGLAVIVVIG